MGGKAESGYQGTPLREPPPCHPHPRGLRASLFLLRLADSAEGPAAITRRPAFSGRVTVKDETLGVACGSWPARGSELRETASHEHQHVCVSLAPGGEAPPHGWSCLDTGALSGWSHRGWALPAGEITKGTPSTGLGHWPPNLIRREKHPGT